MPWLTVVRDARAALVSEDNPVEPIMTWFASPVVGLVNTIRVSGLVPALSVSTLARTVVNDEARLALVVASSVVMT